MVKALAKQGEPGVVRGRNAVGGVVEHRQDWVANFVDNFASGVVQAAGGAAEDATAKVCAVGHDAGVHDDGTAAAGGGRHGRRVGGRLVGDQLGDLAGLAVDNVVAGSGARGVIGVGDIWGSSTDRRHSI